MILLVVFLRQCHLMVSDYADAIFYRICLPTLEDIKLLRSLL